MRAVRDDHTGESQQTVDMPAANLPSMAALLWYDYLATREDSAKQHALAFAESTIHQIGTGGSTTPVARQSLNWELPFYFGNIEAGLERLEEKTRALIETQEDDGRWRYDPTTKSVNARGGSGDTVLGICAHFAFILLKHARISGNENSLNAGLKALKGMDRFKIARGTHVSECSLKTPTLLAAANAVGAYVEAYAITDDKRHTDRAEKWARAGLAFIYHWNLPDRPAMRFASVPAFGNNLRRSCVVWGPITMEWACFCVPSAASCTL